MSHLLNADNQYVETQITTNAARLAFPSSGASYAALGPIAAGYDASILTGYTDGQTITALPDTLGGTGTSRDATSINATRDLGDNAITTYAGTGFTVPATVLARVNVASPQITVAWRGIIDTVVGNPTIFDEPTSRQLGLVLLNNGSGGLNSFQIVCPAISGGGASVSGSAITTGAGVYHTFILTISTSGSNTTFTVYVDGTAYGTAITSTSGAGTFTNALKVAYCSGIGGDNNLYGRTQKLLFYSTALSAGSVSTLHGYLTNGVPASLVPNGAFVSWIKPSGNLAGLVRPIMGLYSGTSPVAVLSHNGTNGLTATLTGATGSTVITTASKVRPGINETMLGGIMFGGASSNGLQLFQQGESVNADSSTVEGAMNTIGGIATPDRVRIYGAGGPTLFTCWALIGGTTLTTATMTNVFATHRPLAMLSPADELSSQFGNTNIAAAGAYGLALAMYNGNGFNGNPGASLSPNGVTTSVPDLVMDIGVTVGSLNQDMLNRFVTLSSGTAANNVSPFDQPQNNTGFFQLSSNSGNPGNYTLATTSASGGGSNATQFLRRSFINSQTVVTYGNSRHSFKAYGGTYQGNSYNTSIEGAIEALYAEHIVGVALSLPIPTNNACVGFDTTANAFVQSGTNVFHSALADNSGTNYGSLGGYSADHSLGWAVLDPSGYIDLLQKPFGKVAANQTLRQKYFYLNTPNTGSFTVQLVRDVAQGPRSNQAIYGTTSASINTSTIPTLTRVLTAAESGSYVSTAIVSIGGTAGILLNLSAPAITVGQICCNGLDVAHVQLVTASGTNKFITFDNAFTNAPTTGASLVFGPWSYGTYQLDQRAVSDPSTWRGVRITSSGTGLGTILLGQAGYNTNTTGVMFAAHATGGEGFTPEAALWNRSGAFNANPRDLWFSQIVTPTIHWFGNSGQNTAPSTAYDTLYNYLQTVAATDCIFFGDTGYGHTAFSGSFDMATEATAFPYMLATATNHGCVAYSPLLNVTGNSMDWLARGYWYDSGNHKSLVGNMSAVRSGLAAMASLVPSMPVAPSGSNVLAGFNNGAFVIGTATTGSFTLTASNIASIAAAVQTNTGNVNVIQWNGSNVAGLPNAGTVTVGTNLDKTNYALTQTFPTNFGVMVISGGGQVDSSRVTGTTGAALSVTGDVHTGTYTAQANMITIVGVAPQMAAPGLLLNVTDSFSGAASSSIATISSNATTAANQAGQANTSAASAASSASTAANNASTAAGFANTAANNTQFLLSMAPSGVFTIGSMANSTAAVGSLAVIGTIAANALAAKNSAITAASLTNGVNVTQWGGTGVAGMPNAGSVVAGVVLDKTGYGFGTNSVNLGTSNQAALTLVAAATTNTATLSGPNQLLLNNAGSYSPTNPANLGSNATTLSAILAAQSNTVNLPYLITGSGTGSQFTAFAQANAPTGGGGGGSLSIIVNPQ